MWDCARLCFGYISKKFSDFGGCCSKSHAFLQGLVWGGVLGCLIIIPPQHQPIIKCGAACPTMGFPPYLQVVQKYCRCNKTSYLKKKCLNVRQKLGTNLSRHVFVFMSMMKNHSRSLTLSLFQSLIQSLWTC